MRSGRRWVRGVASALFAGGMLFAGPGTGCISFGAESLLVATDFCFIFDCQNGILAGTINPCAVRPTTETVTGEALEDEVDALFVDCENLLPP